MSNNRILIAVTFEDNPQPPANMVALPKPKPVIRLLSRFVIGIDGKVKRISGEDLALTA